jgi:hypothetical protein
MIFSPESSIADYNDDFHSLKISDKIIFAKHFHNYFPEKVLEHAMEVLTPTELMEIEHKVSAPTPLLIACNRHTVLLIGITHSNLLPSLVEGQASKAAKSRDARAVSSLC